MFERVSLFVGVIRAADERARLDVAEAEPEGASSELVEFIGMVVASDGQMRE